MSFTLPLEYIQRSFVSTLHRLDLLNVGLSVIDRFGSGVLTSLNRCIVSNVICSLVLVIVVHFFLVDRVWNLFCACLEACYCASFVSMVH
jgi:hypothetical protein